jgi:hypothetical protein
VFGKITSFSVPDFNSIKTVTETNWQNHRVEILTGLGILAGGAAMAVTGGLATIPAAAVVALIATGSLVATGAAIYTCNRVFLPLQSIDEGNLADRVDAFEAEPMTESLEGDEIFYDSVPPYEEAALAIQPPKKSWITTGRVIAGLTGLALLGGVAYFAWTKFSTPIITPYVGPKNPTKEEFLARGEELLKQYGYSGKGVVDCEPYSFTEETTLEQYLKARSDQGCQKILSPEDLGKLAEALKLPPGLDLNQARNIVYHGVIDTIPEAVKITGDKDCLAGAHQASQIRNNALQYTRSLSPQWLTQILEDRDTSKYGGGRDDFSYFVGKYSDKGKQEICDKIIASSQKPNWRYDTGAKVISYVTPLFNPYKAPDDKHVMPFAEWLKGNRTIGSLDEME